MTSHVARLAAVSQVLYDREVLEIGRENARLLRENEAVEALKLEVEALKLERFWKEYDLPKLTRVVTRERIRNRFLTNERPIDPNWDWDVFTGPLIQSYGLEIVMVDRQTLHTSQNNFNVHFVCSELYYIECFGSKLLNAKSIDDPELQKLKALVDELARRDNIQ